MEFYESISVVYDHIFPPNPAQVDFIYQFADTAGSDFRLLDVGCATGSLALALATKGATIWASDFDAEMIKRAKEKQQILGVTSFPVFEQLDMRLIDGHYQPASFNGVVCFGNTLVHLQNEEDIFRFLKAAHHVLQKGGKLLMQILNYDFILAEKIRSLPVIENEQIRFERFYEFPEGLKQIDFNTVLTVKSSGQIISNSVQLNPVRKDELERLLMKAGFQNIRFFGSFKGEPIQPDSLPLIVNAVK